MCNNKFVALVLPWLREEEASHVMGLCAYEFGFSFEGFAMASAREIVGLKHSVAVQ